MNLNFIFAAILAVLITLTFMDITKEPHVMFAPLFIFYLLVEVGFLNNRIKKLEKENENN